MNADIIFKNRISQITLKVEKLFISLFIFQWILGIVFAIFISPEVWSGASLSFSPHLKEALYLGGLVAALPLFCIIFLPAHTATRHVIATCQLLTSTLLIHLSGGRIETHFHVFVSLGFLAFFRDWKVLVTGTTVILLDHFLRGTFWPQSVFGVLTATPWRSVEHAAWAIFEDVVLLYSIKMSRIEMLDIVTAELEVLSLNRDLELKVLGRTEELNAVKIKAEKTLRQFQAVFDNAAVGILVIDRNENIILCNDAVQKMLGYTSEELSQQSIAAITHPDDLMESRKNLKQFSQDKRYVQLKRYLKKNGEVLWIRLTAAVSASQLEDFSAVGIIEDQTSQRAAEETIRQQQALLQASAVQNAHNAGMSEVATGVLHNIGNVLNSVNVGVESMLKRMDESALENFHKANHLLALNKARLETFLTTDPKGKRLVEFYCELESAIRSEVNGQKEEASQVLKKLQLIKDIVNAQQTFARGSKDYKEHLSLPEVIESALAMEALSLVHHEIKVIKKFSNTSPVVAQKTKLIHILLNLIKNSKQAMSRSSGDKTLTLEISMTATGKIALSVHDTGEGILKENIKKIFSHGFTTKVSGHGFGLHFCANAASEMGARISVASPGENQGASFTIEFDEAVELVAVA